MYENTVKSDHETEKIIIEALNMYRSKQVLRSKAIVQDSAQENFNAEAGRSIYMGRQDSTHTTDSSKYLSEIRSQNGLRDSVLISSQVQQLPQLGYFGSRGNIELQNSLAGLASAGLASAGPNSSILPKSLKEFLDSNTSIFQETPMMASAREEPQHRMANKIPDELVCALCGEMYNDPRLLPCLHTFCRRCLEHTVNPRSATITCHSCRKEVSLLVSSGFSCFIDNIAIVGKSIIGLYVKIHFAVKSQA